MSINSRLSRLENMRPSRLVLLARMPDGREKAMLSDLIKTASAAGTPITSTGYA